MSGGSYCDEYPNQGVRVLVLLRIVIVVLALLDGVLHLWLNQALFRGNFFGPQQFPSPFPLQLNQLFTLNFVGYVVLAIVFWYGSRRTGCSALAD